MGNPGPPRRPGPKKRDLTSTDIGDPSPEAGPYNSRRCLRLGFFFFTSDHSARVHVGHNIEFRLWKLRPIITTFPISFTFKGLFPIGLPTELCQNENHLLQPQEMTTPLILSLARLPILTHCSTSSCPYITSLVSLIINLWEAPQKILQTTSLLGVTKQS